MAGYPWRTFLPMKTIRPEADGLPSTIFSTVALPEILMESCFYMESTNAAMQKLAFVSVDEACQAIHQAGGFAVLAHPGYSIKGDRGQYVAQIRRLFTCDLDGIAATVPARWLGMILISIIAPPPPAPFPSAPGTPMRIWEPYAGGTCQCALAIPRSRYRRCAFYPKKLPPPALPAWTSAGARVPWASRPPSSRATVTSSASVGASPSRTNSAWQPPPLV